MTTPAVRPQPPPRDIDEAVQRIRQSGGRVTRSKRAVADLLFASAEPRTAEEIVDHLSDHDRSVVYRCLAQFEELGIAEHVHLGHGQAVYRRRGLTTVLVGCLACGRAFELEASDTDAVVDLVEQRTGVTLNLVHFPLTGRCAACATPP